MSYYEDIDAKDVIKGGLIMTELQTIKRHWENGNLTSGEIAWLIEYAEESLRIETELRGQIRRYLGALQQIRAIGRRTYRTESEVIAELALMEEE